MAENRESVILQVGLDAGKVSQQLADISRQIANVKKEQKQLDDEYKSGKVSLAEYTASTAAMKDETAWLQKEQKGLIATTKLLTETTDTYSDSLNGERQKLADMQKAYDQLDKSMRESEGGKAFLEAIKQQSDAVKGLEEATGRAQRNVGNYSEAFEEGAGKADILNKAFKQTAAGSSILGKAVDGLDKTFKVLVKNPIMALVGLLAPILAKIVSLVTQNSAVVEAFHRVAKPVGKVLQYIADIISKTLVGALNALAKAWSRVKGFFSSIGRLFGGGTKAIEDNTKAEEEAARVAAEYAAQVGNLTAKLKQEQDALKSLQKANKYRLDIMKAQGKAENEITAKNIQYKRDELAAQKQIYEDARDAYNAYIKQLEAQGKREGDTFNIVGDERKKFDELKAQYKAQYETFVDMRRAYNVQIVQATTDLNNQIAERDKKAAEEREAEKKRQYEAERDAYVEHLTQIELLAEAEAATLSAKAAELKETANQLLESLDEDEDEEYIPTLDEMARDMFGLDAEGVEYFKSLLNDGVSIAEAKTQAFMDQTRRMTQDWATSFGFLGSSFEQMGSALGEFAGESEEAAKAQKAFAFSGILLNQAQSISEGALAVASGIRSIMQSPLPALAKIPMVISVVAQISSMIAGVMTSIAQAKQIFSQADAGSFSDGGTIEGNSYTGDRLIAHVNSGEGIYNGKQANNLLQEIANNPLRGGMDQLVEAMTTAIEAMPAPVMVYRELRDFESNVATINEIASV